jgi:hypothetical protein
MGGSSRSTTRAFAIRSFPPAEIPWDQLAFPSTVQVLKDYLKLQASTEPSVLGSPRFGRRLRLNADC